MKKNAHDIILQPLITEKSTILRESQPLYCFKVHRNAGKIEIARAVEELFGGKEKIKVARVRTCRVRGKVKRMGRFFGQRPEWKKAWVRLTDDSKEIEFFEAS